MENVIGGNVLDKNVTKKNVLLIDFNNLAVRCFFTADVGGFTPAPEFQIWKYQVFNSIWSYVWKFEETNEVVLAVDAHKSWRKLFFKRYKESRKVTRDSSDVDWDTFHEQLNSLVEELREYLPFKTLKIENCEADDIIGVLCLSMRNSNFVVVSNDEDYNQLCDPTGRVKIFNPKAKDFMRCDDPEYFIISKCLMGQSKDDIFNVKTSSDWGLTEETQKDGKPKRKPGFGPKTLEKVMKEGYEEWLKKHKLEDNFERNRVLIDFNKIPSTINKRIMSSYMAYKYPDPSNIYEFFKKNNFRSFLEKYEQVENKLLTFY